MVKLTDLHVRILALVAAADPQDVILGVIRALPPDTLNKVLEETPAFRSAVMTRLDGLIVDLQATRQALGGIPSVKGSQATAPTPAVEAVSATDRAVAWLRVNPGKHAPADIRKALGLGPDDKGLAKLTGTPEVKHEGQGAGRKYWVVSGY